MADLERVKAEIAEIATRPNSVRFEELERLVNQLKALGYATASRPGKHSHLFRVGECKFTVCSHNPHRKELKAVYVRSFLEAMADLGLYED